MEESKGNHFLVFIQKVYNQVIKSPLRYPGGKSKAISQIAPLIPHFEEWREPFVGGGSVFIHAKQKYPERRFWINDRYLALFYFWSMCRDDLQQLILQIREWKNQYHDGKELYRFLIKNMDQFDPLRQAVAFFVCNRITFSGTTESGGFSKAAYEKRFTESSIARVELLASILSNTKITNFDYQALIEEPGDHVFLFLDPPYYSATQSALYGKRGRLHTNFDHERFANVMKKTTHQWLITYDDSPYIRELFSFATIQSWHLTYGMRNVTTSSNQLGKELFISNYEIDSHAPKQLSLSFDHG